jgi:hypothetical protein
VTAPQKTLVDALGVIAAKEFAAVLLGGTVGLTLLDQLRELFPAISREDAFLGAVLALSLREADLVAAEIELKQMRALLFRQGAA